MGYWAMRYTVQCTVCNRASFLCSAPSTTEQDGFGGGGGDSKTTALVHYADISGTVVKLPERRVRIFH